MDDFKIFQGYQCTLSTEIWQRGLQPQGNLFELKSFKSFETILVVEENRWWLDHAASIVRFWKAIINKRSQYVDGTSLGVHICQTIAGYQHETPSGTQIAGADSKSRPSTASGATIWLRSGSQYRWLEGLAYRFTQHASTSPIYPYPLSMINSSICINLLWSDWIFLGMSSMKPSKLGSPCYRDS